MNPSTSNPKSKIPAHRELPRKAGHSQRSGRAPFRCQRPRDLCEGFLDPRGSFAAALVALNLRFGMCVTAFCSRGTRFFSVRRLSIEETNAHAVAVWTAWGLRRFSGFSVLAARICTHLHDAASLFPGILLATGIPS